MDEMRLEEMSFYGYHGCRSEEHSLGQRFNVTAILRFDFSQASQTDDILKTIDYCRVYATIKSIVEEEKYHLIETLAEKIAQQLLVNFVVEEVEVEVAKPTPPFECHLKQIAVRVKRCR